MNLNVAVIGAGSWGTTVASIAARRRPTIVWSYEREVAGQIRDEHRNEKYLPGFELPPGLRATADMEEAVRGADVLFMATPSFAMRGVLGEIATHVRPWIPVVNLAKGFEQNTKLRMTEVIEQALPRHPIGAMSGPNIAVEVMAGYAAASLVAFADPHVAAGVRDAVHSGLFRVYTGRDVIGTEVAGALKNVIAIAVGMGDGIGVGMNTKAAVITRGLAELTRLGVEMGGEERTFAGLAGMGDLIVTCLSTKSRNYRVGLELGRGRALPDVLEDMTQVAEGVSTAAVTMELAEKLDCEMPIAAEVARVLYEGQTAAEAYRGLFRRHPAGTEQEPA